MTDLTPEEREWRNLTIAERRALIVSFTKADDDCAHNFVDLFHAVENIVTRRLEVAEADLEAAAHRHGQLRTMLANATAERKAVLESLADAGDILKRCEALADDWLRRDEYGDASLGRHGRDLRQALRGER